MEQQEFIKQIEAIYKKNLDTCKRKNADYAGDDDALKNFMACELLGIPAEIGILVRMSDKIMRAANLANPRNKAQVKNEKVVDTLADLANYAAILIVMINYRTTTKSGKKKLLFPELVKQETIIKKKRKK